MRPQRHHDHEVDDRDKLQGRQGEKDGGTAADIAGRVVARNGWIVGYHGGGRSRRSRPLLAVLEQTVLYHPEYRLSHATPCPRRERSCTPGDRFLSLEMVPLKGGGPEPPMLFTELLNRNTLRRQRNPSPNE